MRNLILTSVALLALSIGAARADGVRAVYDSRPVAAGAAIDSGAQAIGGSTAVTCYLTNADAGARNFTVIFLADDKTTTVFQPAVVSATGSGTNGGYSAITIGLGATASTNVTAIAVLPARWMQFKLAVGGSSNGRIYCVGR